MSNECPFKWHIYTHVNWSVCHVSTLMVCKFDTLKVCHNHLIHAIDMISINTQPQYVHISVHYKIKSI